MFLTIILAVGAYFVGSISFSYLLTKKVTGEDIRNMDLKNAGALNVILNVNKRVGAVVGLLDLLKTLLIVLIGEALGLSPVYVIVAASFGVIGHCFPVYHKFYGGKGAASVIGVLIYYIPLELVLSVIPAALFAALIHRLGTTPVFMFLFSPFLAWLLEEPTALVWGAAYLAVLIGLLNAFIIWTRRDRKFLPQ